MLKVLRYPTFCGGWTFTLFVRERADYKGIVDARKTVARQFCRVGGGVPLLQTYTTKPPVPYVHSTEA